MDTILQEMLQYYEVGDKIPNSFVLLDEVECTDVVLKKLTVEIACLEPEDFKKRFIELSRPTDNFPSLSRFSRLTENDEVQCIFNEFD